MIISRIKCIFIVIVAAFTLTACSMPASSAKSSISQEKTAHTAELQSVKTSINGINIMVDPRIELLAVVQLISNYDRKLLTRENFSYKDRIKSKFSRYSKHSAVTIFEKMSGRFNCDAPPTAMLYLSNPPDLKKVQDFSEYLYSRADRNVLEKFVAELRNFSEETGFVKFYNSNKGFYSSMIKKNSEMIGDNHYIEELESYYGMKQNSYNIILSALYSGGYGPNVKTPGGGYDIYNIDGPIAINNDIPLFGDKDGFKQLAWHEFGHSFVNPLTERYQNEVSKSVKLYSPIVNKMQQQNYTNWLTCVNEHINRAITCRLIYLHDGAKAYQKAIAREKRNGFFYIEALDKKLQVYEKNRDKYKSFESFYPELIKVFGDLAKTKLGKDFYSVRFLGPINDVCMPASTVTIIIPTNESDKNAQNSIKKSVDHISSFMNTKGIKTEIITDEQALKGSMGGKNIFAYGTVKGNLWLKEYASSFPFDISDDSITADRVYKGTKLRLISAVPNPVDKYCGMVIYTAQRAKDIPDINAVYHGPTDFVISEGTNVITSGDYIKDGDTWQFDQGKNND